MVISAAHLAASDGQCVSTGMMPHSTRRELLTFGPLRPRIASQVPYWRAPSGRLMEMMNIGRTQGGLT